MDNSSVAQSGSSPALPVKSEGPSPSWPWRPISEAPRDAEPIWGFLFETGIRLLRWASPAECAEYEGNTDIEDYDGCWVEVADFDEEWSPTWWLPFALIGLPPGATIKGADVAAQDTTDRQSQIPGGAQS